MTASQKTQQVEPLIRSRYLNLAAYHDDECNPSPSKTIPGEGTDLAELLARSLRDPQGLPIQPPEAYDLYDDMDEDLAMTMLDPTHTDGYDLTTADDIHRAIKDIKARMVASPSGTPTPASPEALKTGIETANADTNAENTPAK